MSFGAHDLHIFLMLTNAARLVTLTFTILRYVSLTHSVYLYEFNNIEGKDILETMKMN